MMHLNVVTRCVPSPLFEGLWRETGDRSATGYRSLRYWTDMARKLEAACLDAVFFADMHGVHDIYGGDAAASVRHAVECPAIDPVPLIPALSAVTERLGFVVTLSTSYFQPYHCARLFSTLDHLTEGRIGWNIVTSDLRMSEKIGMGEYVPHDERYDRADEYMTVVRSLWERSWADRALRRDVAEDLFSDPADVRNVTFDGRWFSLDTPHSSEPSPQRTPFLYQAGSSDRGVRFAAQWSEVVFVTLSSPRRGKDHVARLRQQAAERGRDPRSIKIIQGMPFLIGVDEGDVRAKADRFVSLTSRGGLLAKWCGWVGVDLAAYPDDAKIHEVLAEDGKSVTGFFAEAGPTRDWTVADVRDFVAVPRRPHRYDRLTLCGTPSQVADRMEEYLTVADVDGFNVYPCPPSSGIDDLCDLLIPELQRRGLFRTAYDPAETTLRERHLGSGQTRCAVPADLLLPEVALAAHR